MYPYYRSYQHPAQRVADDRARAIAEQRARRAQWLPEEDYDYDEDWEYNQLGPRERAYVDAQRNQAIRAREFQRRQQEEAAALDRALREQRWQQELIRRQQEEEATRQRVEHERERRRQLQQQQEREHQLYEQQYCSRSRSRGPPQQYVPPPYPNVRSTPPPNGYIPTFPQAQAYQKPASPRPQRQPTPPPAPEYTEKHNEAASTIQHRFRIRQSFQTIKSLSEEFDSIRKDFTFPSIISFQNSSPAATSSEATNVPAIPITEFTENEGGSELTESNAPKLAFNSTNFGLHSYMDTLDRLLVKLDGVESWGDPDVRTKRRGVVKRIENEQTRVDKFCKQSWAKFIARGRRFGS